MTPRWYPLRYHADHDSIMQSSARFILARAGRRSGKTEIGKRRLVMALAEDTGFQDSRYFYAAPTRQQAKDIAWDDLKAMTPPEWLAGRPIETELKINTKFGSTLTVVGLDQPQRIEGRGYDGGMVDEMSDVKPKALSVSIYPALADRRGWLYLSGVPKRAGVGAVSFNQLFDEARENGTFPGTSDRVEAYAWESATVLSESELAFFQGLMDEKDFDEQFRALIQTVGGAVFHAFGNHNIEPVQYDPSLPIIVGSDFNVDPMCWILAQDQDGKLRQFDEVWLRNTNTPATLDHLYSRYGSHGAGWSWFGDASSRARETSATKSDYLHILNDDRFRHKRVVMPKRNPMILDRISSCNALFRSAKNEVRFTIDPGCKRTINDIKVRSYKEGSLTLDDGLDVGHITDALGYVINSLYPITLPATKSATAGVRMF